jgi:hypothetical protein
MPGRWGAAISSGVRRAAAASLPWRGGRPGGATGAWGGLQKSKCVDWNATLKPLKVAGMSPSRGWPSKSSRAPARGDVSHPRPSPPPFQVGPRRRDHGTAEEPAATAASGGCSVARRGGGLAGELGQILDLVRRAAWPAGPSRPRWSCSGGCARAPLRRPSSPRSGRRPTARSRASERSWARRSPSAALSARLGARQRSLMPRLETIPYHHLVASVRSDNRPT